MTGSKWTVIQRLRVALAGLVITTWVLGFSGGVQAHPTLEQDPSDAMKGPGIQATRRAPLGLHPPKVYLPFVAIPQEGVGGRIAENLLSFYRNVISPLDGDRCVMAPTCSLYGHQAVREYGPWMGMVLIADRLLHEADEIPLVPIIIERNEKLYLDPLESNTYWLWSWLR